MARARNIKPGFFKNEDLGTADPFVSLLFAGLWTLADKSGILEDRPLRIKAELFPYRDGFDINGYLTVLTRLGFIHRYEVDGLKLIQVANFEKHQNPHHTEKKSEYPSYSDSCQQSVKAPLINGDAPADSLIPDSLIPDSLIPDSLIPDSLIPDSLIPDSCDSSSGDEPRKRKRFEKPTLDQVREYCHERGNSVDHEHWFSHYSSNGWKVGKNPMVDWRAAVRTWERNSNGKHQRNHTDIDNSAPAKVRRAGEQWLREREQAKEREIPGERIE